MRLSLICMKCFSVNNVYICVNRMSLAVGNSGQLVSESPVYIVNLYWLDHVG